jgi:hypothetical protein
MTCWTKSNLPCTSFRRSESSAWEWRLAFQSQTLSAFCATLRATPTTRASHFATLRATSSRPSWTRPEKTDFRSSAATECDATATSCRRRSAVVDVAFAWVRREGDLRFLSESEWIRGTRKEQPSVWRWNLWKFKKKHFKIFESLVLQDDFKALNNWIKLMLQWKKGQI